MSHSPESDREAILHRLTLLTILWFTLKGLAEIVRQILEGASLAFAVTNFSFIFQMLSGIFLVGFIYCSFGAASNLKKEGPFRTPWIIFWFQVSVFAFLFLARSFTLFFELPIPSTPFGFIYRALGIMEVVFLALILYGYGDLWKIMRQPQSPNLPARDSEEHL